MIVDHVACVQVSTDDTVVHRRLILRCRLHWGQAVLKVIAQMSIAVTKAPRERFELPRLEDSGFRIHRNTGLCDLGRECGFSATVISMMLCRCTMEIHLTGRDYDVKLEAKKPLTVRAALSQAGILASTVIVSIDGVIIPHSTIVSQSVELLVTTISSGG